MKQLDALVMELDKTVAEIKEHISALEPKKEVKVREFWVNGKDSIINKVGNFYEIDAWGSPCVDYNPNEMHFRELLPHERVVTKNDLLLAMEALQPSSFDSVGNALFKKFCKELGFKDE